MAWIDPETGDTEVDIIGALMEVIVWLVSAGRDGGGNRFGTVVAPSQRK